MPYVPKEITEEVNVTPVHPLVNVAYLLATVACVGALIYGGLGLVASQMALRMSRQTEEKIGATLVASLPFEADQRDRRVTYLNQLLEKLQAGAAQTVGPAQYPPPKVSILDMPVENAMVTAGSYLFVTDGLLAAVESENELAFVLAHELGHLHHRDPLQALGRSLVFITLNSLLGLGLGPRSLAGAVNLAELSYSRQQEIAADDYAIALMMAHYHHGGHSLGFFERARARDFDWGALKKVAQWQQTHPLTDDRIRRIENTFEQNNWPLTGELTPLPQLIGCPDFEPCQ